MAKKLSEGRKVGSGRKPGKAKTLAEGRKVGSGRKKGSVSKTLADGRKAGSGRKKLDTTTSQNSSVNSVINGAISVLEPNVQQSNIEVNSSVMLPRGNHDISNSNSYQTQFNHYYNLQAQPNQSFEQFPLFSHKQHQQQQQQIQQQQQQQHQNQQIQRIQIGLKDHSPSPQPVNIPSQRLKTVPKFLHQLQSSVQQKESDQHNIKDPNLIGNFEQIGDQRLFEQYPNETEFHQYRKLQESNSGKNWTQAQQQNFSSSRISQILNSIEEGEDKE